MKTLKNNLLLFGLILTLFAMNSCEEIKTYETDKEPPIISSFEPTIAKVGDKITITGEHLQFVESAFIGGTQVVIKEKLSANKIIIEASLDAVSTPGQITLSNRNGSATTETPFKFDIVIPKLNIYPNTAKVFENIIVEGENLASVKEIWFKSRQGRILRRQYNEIVVEVPYYPEISGDISLKYWDGSKMEEEKTPDNSFEITEANITITGMSSNAAVPNDIIILTGTNLRAIDKIMLGDKEAIIIDKDDHNKRSNEKLYFQLPNFTKDEIVNMDITYFETEKIRQSSSFNLVVPNTGEIYFWGQRTLSCQDGTQTNNFFSALTGEIYSPCDYKSAPNPTLDNLGVTGNTFLFFAISGGNITLQNPNNAQNIIKNFRCDGSNLDTKPGWRVLKYRNLRPTSTSESYLYNMVKSKTLTKIDNDILATSVGNVSEPSSNVITNNLAANSSNTQFTEGSVVLFTDYGISETILTPIIHSEYFKGRGFIEILKIEEAGNKSQVTINVYYQK